MQGAAKKSLDQPDQRVTAEGVAADVRGIAVHEASRIAAAADAGEILVSATTRALAGSDGLSFVDRGSHELKGLDGARELFGVSPAT